MGNRPDFNLLVPIESEGKDGKKRTQWVRFGSLWRSKDGNSYSSKVDFWPVSVPENRVVLMPPETAPAKARAVTLVLRRKISRTKPVLNRLSALRYNGKRHPEGCLFKWEVEDPFAEATADLISTFRL